MSVAIELVLIVLSVGGLLAAMAGVHFLAQRFGWSAELQRKTVHVATGLYALTLPLTFSEAWPVLLLSALAILVMAVMRVPALARSGIGSTIHAVERQSYGEILLAVSVGFLFFRSIGSPVLFVLPMLVLTFSDAAAALTGVHYGRKLFPVEKGAKSVEGVVMFFLVTFIISMVTLLLMTEVPRANVVVMSFILAAFGAQLEADSWRGLDNLFVPVGVHLFLQNNIETPLVGLLATALLYVTIVGVLVAAAPRLDITGQAARGYGVLAFLILSVTSPVNALLPMAAFVLFVVLRRGYACRSTYPDLDFLAAATGTAMWWLFAGEWSGHNAINFYNLTFAGVAATFAVLLLHNRSLVLAGLLALGLAAAVYGIQFANNTDAQWMSGFSLAVLVSLGLCVAVAFSVPRWFERYRSARAFIVALLVPLSSFAWKVLV